MELHAAPPEAGAMKEFMPKPDENSLRFLIRPKVMMTIGDDRFPLRRAIPLS
jgi:hypothetical protein